MADFSSLSLHEQTAHTLKSMTSQSSKDNIIQAKCRNIQVVSHVPEKQNSKSLLTSVHQKLHTSIEFYEHTGFN